MKAYWYGRKLFKKNALGVKFVVPRELLHIKLKNSFEYDDPHWFKGDVYFDNGEIVYAKNTNMAWDYDSWSKELMEDFQKAKGMVGMLSWF